MNVNTTQEVVPVPSSSVFGLIARHATGALGGFLAAQGVSGDYIELLVGIALAAASVAWSWLEKRYTKVV